MSRAVRTARNRSALAGRRRTTEDPPPPRRRTAHVAALRRAGRQGEHPRGGPPRPRQRTWPVPLDDTAPAGVGALLQTTEPPATWNWKFLSGACSSWNGPRRSSGPLARGELPGLTDDELREITAVAGKDAPLFDPDTLTLDGWWQDHNRIWIPPDIHAIYAAPDRGQGGHLQPRPGPRSTASRFWSPMTATRGSSATAATEARPRPVAAGPAPSERRHDEADSPPPGRQARHPRVPLAGRRLASRADPPPRRKPERAAALGGSRALRGPRRRLASSRRLRAPAGRAGLSWTPRPQSGGESVTTAPAKRRETPEPSQEPPQSSPRRTPKGPITHDLDETRSQDIPWSLCGVLLYDPRQIAKEGEPATCGKCQRFRSAASYRKRQAAMKAAKKET